MSKYQLDFFGIDQFFTNNQTIYRFFNHISEARGFARSYASKNRLRVRNVAKI